MSKSTNAVFFIVITIICVGCTVEVQENPRQVPIMEGWAGNSINTVIFRRNSVVTHEDVQYAAFYDADQNVNLARRPLGSIVWQVKKTGYRGDTRDAHNSISIMVDGEGYLHMAWDHHVDSLRYCRSLASGSLELSEKIPMTGKNENYVTYPEFYRLPEGDLLFLYRDGSSGKGNLVMNRYSVKDKRWIQVHYNLIDGEGQRNAYWQAAVDVDGIIHLSWVWRETPDVATNHDICYARSMDGGNTWLRSTGEPYVLPITEETAEYARRIPQNSELINQTSMNTDNAGHPYIATYWRPEGTDVPQYHIVYSDGTQWQTQQVTRRTTPFSLSGEGTRRIPISRPQIVIDVKGGVTRAYLLYRDVERDSRVSVAICDDLSKRAWRYMDLTMEPVGQWEPSYDTELWKRSHILHVFLQKVGQGDGEKTESISPQTVSILEWQPL